MERSIRLLHKVANSAQTAAHVITSSVHFNPKAAVSLDELKMAFSGFPQFHRFPCTARYDFKDWKSLPPVGSKSQAVTYAKMHRRPGALETDMCASAGVALSMGAPPSLLAYSQPWGGLSSFFPIGARGKAAWRYAHETMSLALGKSHLGCFVTTNPSVSLRSESSGPASLKFVVDRTIGRSWTEVTETLAAAPSDRACFPDDQDLREPLAYHVLMTPFSPAPVSMLDRLALCHGWDACEPTATQGMTIGDCCTVVNGVVSVPPGIPHTIVDASSLVVDPRCIHDQQLGDVERLLEDGLLHVDAPAGLCVEALLYSYLFQHHQAYFAGRIDRVLALDGGRCAYLLLAAAERAFPGGNYGRNWWAHDAVGPLVRAARAFVAQAEI